MGHISPVYSPCHEKYSGIPTTTVDDLAVALEDLVHHRLLSVDGHSRKRCTVPTQSGTVPTLDCGGC